MKKRYVRHARPTDSKAALRQEVIRHRRAVKIMEGVTETANMKKNAMQNVLDASYLTMKRLMGLRFDMVRREDSHNRMYMQVEADFRGIALCDYEAYSINFTRAFKERFYAAVADKAFKEQSPVLDNASVFDNMQRYVSHEARKKAIMQTRQCPRCELNLLRFMDYRGRVHDSPIPRPECQVMGEDPILSAQEYYRR